MRVRTRARVHSRGDRGANDGVGADISPIGEVIAVLHCVTANWC